MCCYCPCPASALTGLRPRRPRSTLVKHWCSCCVSGCGVPRVSSSQTDDSLCTPSVVHLPHWQLVSLGYSVGFLLLHQPWLDSSFCNKGLASICLPGLANLWCGQASTGHLRALAQQVLTEPVWCAGDTEVAAESLPCFFEDDKLKMLLKSYGSLGNEAIWVTTKVLHAVLCTS